MKLYSLLEAVPWTRSDFSRKLGVVLFGASQLPLCLYALIKWSLGSPFDNGIVLSVACLSLLGFISAYLAMRMLLTPLDHMEESLRTFLTASEHRPLPTVHADLLGRLMRDIEHATQRGRRALRHIQRDADFDDLTGVYTRRAAKRRLVEDCARAERNGLRFH